MPVDLASRIISPILLLAGTFTFGILPIPIRRTLLKCECVTEECKKTCKARKGKLITTFLIYFGGGVLLATCLIHLLPEAREGFEKHSEILKEAKKKSLVNQTTEEEEGHHEEFPLPEFVVCCGFFAVYLVEEVIHFFLGGHSHIPTETRAIRSVSRTNSCSSSVCEPGVIHISNDLDTTSYKRESFKVSQQVFCDQNNETETRVSMGFTISGLLTVVALSFHSLFEGFAIGLQNTTSGLWILFAAVSVHKFVIAFVIGLEVIAAGGRDLLVTIYMVVFSAMSPTGMVIAMITQIEAEDSSPLTVGVLNAIATGTLLYVTFCEILQREEDHNLLAGWQQFLATFLGFAVMCTVQYASTYA